MRRTAAVLGAALALAVTVTTGATAALPAAGQGTGHPTAVTPARALARLTAESHGRVRVSRGASGAVRYVGLGAESADPAVTSTTDPRQAARTHLARYGAVLGLDARTRLRTGRVTPSVGGDTVVRFTQTRDGLPVIGGSVAVDLRGDRQLGSVFASLSEARAGTRAPSISRQRATRDALALTRRRNREHTRRHTTGLTVDTATRWLYDPAVLGVPRTSDPTTHARSVWRVEVSAGPTVRRLVLVDDHTGAVVLDVDLIERLDRVVCDDQNTFEIDVPCSKDFARTETSPPSAVPDVNSAFDLAGVVSRYYAQVGDIDLTDLIGVREHGQKVLASTVRHCQPEDSECPLPNAFWNGQQMFYGDGFAGADDVVGHEMTHGVISHNADLLYWGQSGALNESLADVMGEIIDHRHHTAGEQRDNWTLGEDLPIRAVRNMRHPTKFHQPGSMTSKRYVGGTVDSGGVHTNSGVGNRTFYLISQGGHGRGGHIRGIDGRRLTKTATLYLWVIQHLSSGGDYNDLASALEQGCTDLARHHTARFHRSDCRSVRRAVRTTRLRTTPPAAPQPPDAPMTCPGTGRPQVLFDSEKGHRVAHYFRAGPTWERAPAADVPANAISGRHSWYSADPDARVVSNLVLRRTVALPDGQRSYLWFRHWWVLDFLSHHGFDGGIVALADATTRHGGNLAQRPWVNGPTDRIHGQYGNPAGSPHAFVIDSHGWLASRVDLTRNAGHAVRPRFTLASDKTIGFPGWFLDDIRVYTCGSDLYPTGSPQVTGTPRVGHRLAAGHGRWSLGHHTGYRYQWLADGRPIAGADHASYRPRARDRHHHLSVRVTAHHRGRAPVSTTSAGTGRVH